MRRTFKNLPRIKVDSLQKSLAIFDQLDRETRAGGVMDAATLDKYLETRLEEVKSMINPALPVPQTVRVSKR